MPTSKELYGNAAYSRPTIIGLVDTLRDAGLLSAHMVNDSTTALALSTEDMLRLTEMVRAARG